MVSDGKARVLVVDDDADCVQLYERCLRSDFEVVGVQSGQSALRELQSRSFSLIISDQRMPEVSGVEVLEEGARLQPRARRVMVSGVAETDELARAVDCGWVERFLAKPVSRHELLRCALDLTGGTSGSWLVLGTRDSSERWARLLEAQGEHALAASALPEQVEAQTLMLVDPLDLRVVQEARSLTSGEKCLVVGFTRGDTPLAGAALSMEDVQVMTLPQSAEELLRRVTVWEDRKRWHLEALRLRERLMRSTVVDGLVGSCPPMLQAFHLVSRFAQSEGDCLIWGESGTGKAALSQELHRLSSASGACLSVSLEGLSEADCEERAFTEVPVGGTLLIRGIEGLSPRLQGQLAHLRVHRGSGTRLICTSSLAPDELDPRLLEVFGERLVSLPPLHARGADIVALAEHFLSEACRKNGREGRRLGREAMAAVCTHAWPGNLVELRSAIERAVVGSQAPAEFSELLVADLRSPIVVQVVEDIIGGGRGLDGSIAELESAVIAEALRRQRGNRSAAARQLKLPRQTLQDRMKKHGLWS